MLRKGIRTLLIITMLLFTSWVFNAEAQEANRLGLNTTLRTFGDDVKRMQELGVGIIRVPLMWQLVRLPSGNYDWSMVDRFVKTAQMKGMEVLFTIRTTFHVVTKAHQSKRAIRSTFKSPPPVNIEHWVEFAEKLAKRYRGQGVHYEVENEVNVGTFWRPPLEDYLDLLKEVYKVIKREDPKAKVLPSAMGCGIVGDFRLDSDRQEAWKWHDSWLQPILSTKAFDIVNVHDYYFPSEILANGLTFKSYLEHIHGLMKKSGVEGRPIWITETGFVSLPAEAGDRLDRGSPEKQAKWLTEAYQQTFELGVERIYWLLLRDRKEPYFGSMGLADAKGNPRPAWNSFQQIIKGKGEK